MNSIKDKIIGKAEALFMRNGIKAVSMDDLARDLGMSKKTLYEHVENKADLVKQIMEMKIEQDTAMVIDAIKRSDNALEELFIIARAVTRELRAMPQAVMFELKKYHRSTFEMLEQYHQNYIYKVMLENIQRGMKEGLYREDIHPIIVAKLYVGKNMMIVDEESFPLEDFHRDQLFVEHMRYHIHGIASARGIKLLEKYAKVYEK